MGILWYKVMISDNYKINRKKWRLRFFCFDYERTVGLRDGLIEMTRLIAPDSVLHFVKDYTGGGCLPEPECVGRVVYDHSNWRRMGNLNGPECITGELEYMARHTRGDEYAVKIDSDWVVLNPDKVRDVFRIESSVGFMACQVPAYFFGGYFYAIRVDVLGLIRRLWPDSIENILSGAREDVTIGSYAYMAANMLNLRSVILPIVARGKYIQGAYDHAAKDKESYLKKLFESGCMMLTTGNPGVTVDMMEVAQKGVLEFLRGGSKNPEKNL